MKTLFFKSIFAGCFLLAAFASSAQHPRITVKQLQEVSQAKLAACNDTSAYFNDTVTVVAVVTADANLIDVPSSSVQGGFRPFVHVLDTANEGQGGDFHGLQVMGVYTDAGGNYLPVTDVYNLYAGMVIEITGTISRYQGETQLSLLNNSSLKVIGNQAKPKPVVVDLGKLNDNTRTNKLTTGEEYEDSYIELRNLTVINVQHFNGNRVSFDVADGDGNVINVSDRFFAQKTSSYTTTRASAPKKQGSFVPPVVGSKFDYIRGIVMHSENGCTGNSSGRGYEINPTDTSDYRVGKTPPNITNVVRTPLVPKADEKAKITCKIVDFDGSVKQTKLYYSTDMGQTYDQFTSADLTLKSGTTDEYEAEIPGYAENTIVRYYIFATDDIDQESYFPFAANASKNPDFAFYTVRNSGLRIPDVQRVLNFANDASPFENEEVTVTGVVTASAKAYDLEQVYIQDPDADKWAGIKCQGNSDLIKLYRGQEVTVTGTINESYGFTVLNVTNVVKTGEIKEVKVTTLDPSDSAFYSSKEAEAYEGMLVGFVNPGDKIYVSNPMLSSYGEYLVSTSEDASYGRSRRVQAGIQNTNNASSLWVSIVSEARLKDEDGSMNVTPIVATKGMSFDTLVGMLYYGFGNYSLLPRNDDDFIGASVSLPATDYPDIVSVRNLKLNNAAISFYPNPASESITLKTENGQVNEVTVTISDLTGKQVKQATIYNGQSIDISNLKPGVYMVKGNTDQTELGAFRLIKE